MAVNAAAVTSTTMTIRSLPCISSPNKPFSIFLPNTRGTPPVLHITLSSKNPISQFFPNNKNEDSHSDDYNDDKPREECGVVGVYGDPEASQLCLYALHALQHRGQEGAGIVSVHDSILNSVTGVGLVSDVFNPSKLDQLPGDLAIGHVRYSTAGSSNLINVQPFMSKYNKFSVAHNGNLVNYSALRSDLEGINGSIFNTSSDTEAILHLVETSNAPSFVLKIIESCKRLEGAFSMVFCSEDNKLVAVRDPLGFRPLVMGRTLNGGVVIASETCALDLIKATYEREVLPGEVIVVDKIQGIQSYQMPCPKESKYCIFEHIYFANLTSIVYGRSVYASRRAFGELLSTESPVECDVVIGVPDSGVAAAQGYAKKSGVRYEQGFNKSAYVTRVFIHPSQKMRDLMANLKLSVVRDVVEGKRVVVVDDSIVRGTMAPKIVDKLREAGAKEVHVRIASPPVIGSCYYGVDTPSPEKLIANKMDLEEMRSYIGADSLAFLSIDKLRNYSGEDDSNKYCYACFTGIYPTATLNKEVEINEGD